LKQNYYKLFLEKSTLTNIILYIGVDFILKFQLNFFLEIWNFYINYKLKKERKREIIIILFNIYTNNIN
jgi:hypothetical protein